MYSYNPERGAIAVALAVAEITDIWYWDSSLGIYNPWLTEPPTILIGTEAGAQAIVRNLSDEYLDLGLIVTAYDPLGNPLGLRIVGPTRLAPGDSLSNHYRVVTERPGIYTITTDIITSPTPPYGKIGPTLSWPVAYVVGELPPLVGHVYDPFVLDVTTGEAFYSLPVEIDWGHEVIVGIHWINDGGETATFTPTFELIDPDGISREIQTFNTELSPSEHTGGQTGDSVKLDKAGMWKIHAILKAEGTLLDEKTWDAISVTAIPPPDYRGFEIISYSPTELHYGDNLTVACRVEHIGEAQSGKLRVAIGNRGVLWFDEILYKEVSVSFPESQGWEWKNITVSINITEAIAPGTYELYAKLFGITGPDLYDYTPDDVFTVVAPPVEYKGTITEMKLEYDETQAPIPVSSIPQGASALLRVTGRNDTPDAQRMGISWMVYDPLGGVVNQYAAWEDWPYTGGYKEHEFHKFGGEFTLSEEGKYTTVIWLLMNPDDPVVVDSYDGDLCTVTPEVPPEEYELIYHYEYPLAKTYVGKAEECTASLRVNLPDQLFPNSWVVNKIVDTFEEKVGEHAAQMLDIKIYEDAIPTWHTDYRIVATATASPIPWAVIIPLVLAIILVIAFTNLVVKVKDIDWGEIPPEISWLPLVLIGGLGVLGVGAAVALGTRK